MESENSKKSESFFQAVFEWYSHNYQGNIPKSGKIQQLLSSIIKGIDNQPMDQNQQGFSDFDYAVDQSFSAANPQGLPAKEDSSSDVLAGLRSMDASTEAFLQAKFCEVTKDYDFKKLYVFFLRLDLSASHLIEAVDSTLTSTVDKGKLLLQNSGGFSKAQYFDGQIKAYIQAVSAVSQKAIELLEEKMKEIFDNGAYVIEETAGNAFLFSELMAFASKAAKKEGEIAGRISYYARSFSDLNLVSSGMKSVVSSPLQTHFERFKLLPWYKQGLIYAGITVGIGLVVAAAYFIPPVVIVLGKLGAVSAPILALKSAVLLLVSSLFYAAYQTKAPVRAPCQQDCKGLLFTPVSSSAASSSRGSSECGSDTDSSDGEGLTGLSAKDLQRASSC